MVTKWMYPSSWFKKSGLLLADDLLDAVGVAAGLHHVVVATVVVVVTVLEVIAVAAAIVVAEVVDDRLLEDVHLSVHADDLVQDLENVAILVIDRNHENDQRLAINQN